MGLANLRTDHGDPEPEEGPDDAPVNDATTAAAVKDDLEAELGQVIVSRDLAHEGAPPPTATQEETERTVEAAADRPADTAATAGGDPRPDESAAASPAKPTAAPAAPSGGMDGLSKFKFDEAIQKILAPLSEESRSKLFKDLEGKRITAERLQKRAEELGLAKQAGAEQGQQRRRPPPHIVTALFFGLAEALYLLRTGSAASTKRKLAAVADDLSPDNIRDRIRLLRRQEIIDAAASMGTAHSGMGSATRRFNQTFTATEAGRKFEAMITAHMAQRPDATREDILDSMNGDAPNPLRNHMLDAFKSSDVKAQWAAIDEQAAKLAVDGRALSDRMRAFEEHFPGHIDAEKMKSVVEDALEQIAAARKNPLARNPESLDGLKKQMEKVAAMIQEMMDRLMSMVGLKPKP